jgi:hypothetical protein
MYLNQYNQLVQLSMPNVTNCVLDSLGSIFRE